MSKEIRGQVAGLFRFPVSSLGGEKLETASLGASGIEGDRAFGFYERDSNVPIYPARDARWNNAPLIHARLAPELQLSVDGNHWFAPDDPQGMAQVDAVFGHPVDLHSYGPGRRPRYRMSPLHVLSLQSIEKLRAMLPSSQIDNRRFRANILVDLPDVPGDVPEYALLGQEFTLGSLRLRGTMPCARCGFTTLETEGLPADPLVLRTLVQKYERNFGIYCDVVQGGVLHSGDVLTAKADAAPVDPVVIVGAGQAGAMAARVLRDLGYTGTIRLFGAERHPPYERPPLSKRIGRKDAEPHVPTLQPSEAEALRISMHLDARVDAIDVAARRIELADGTQTAFGTLILATGGSARRIPDLDRGYGRVHVLRTLEHAERLGNALAPGARVFVIGGGWIGMEAAAVACEAGAEVTLYARSARLAPRILPKEVADRVADLLREGGISLRMGVDPTFRETEEGITCQIGTQISQGDHLVVAIGMVPQDGLARRAGIPCAEGVLTDEDGATSINRIFAIGDVSQQPGGRIESWQNANHQAERAARRILEQGPGPREPLRFWSEQFGRRLQIVGRPDPDAAIVATDRDFWDFGTFAIGIDRPELVHRAALRFMDEPPMPSKTPPPSFPREEHFLAPSDAVAEGELVQLVHPVRGALAVTRQQGQVYATDDRCPHAVASLSAGFVEDGRIVCPLHFAEFDLTDGAPHHAPTGCSHLLVHPVEERDGALFVLLPAPTRATAEPTLSIP